MPTNWTDLQQLHGAGARKGFLLLLPTREREITPEQLEHETVNCPLCAWIILQRHKGITPELAQNFPQADKADTAKLLTGHLQRQRATGLILQHPKLICIISALGCTWRRRRRRRRLLPSAAARTLSFTLPYLSPSLIAISGDRFDRLGPTLTT